MCGTSQFAVSGTGQLAISEDHPHSQKGAEAVPANGLLKPCGFLAKLENHELATDDEPVVERVERGKKQRLIRLALGLRPRRSIE